MENRASFGVRLGASLLDSLFTTIFSGIIGLIIGLIFGMVFSNFSENELKTTIDITSNILSFIIFFIYSITLPVFMNGQTLGKKICGIRIQTQSGQKLTLGKMFLREFIGKLISMLILFIGYLMALGKDRLALHDKMAKTEVVKAK